jgi:hypothetical protein
MLWRIPSTSDPHLGSFAEVVNDWSFEDLMAAHLLIDEIERARKVRA